MKRQLMKIMAAAAFCAMPAFAFAATSGIATANVNMRSGPSTQYPAVVVVPAGAPITINGCLSNVNWCDVTFARGRGWVSGSYIQATYRQNRVYVGPQYYQPLGIPTITFDVDTYWNRYYRDRDFYRERDRWSRWDYRREAPPPPRFDPRRDDPIRDPNRFREDGRYRYDDRGRMDDRNRYPDRDRNGWDNDRRGGFDRRDDQRPDFGPRGDDNGRNGWDRGGDRRPDDRQRGGNNDARPDDRRGPPRPPEGGPPRTPENCTPDRPCAPPGQ